MVSLPEINTKSKQYKNKTDKRKVYYYSGMAVKTIPPVAYGRMLGNGDLS